jgi:hypothetical protein
MAKTKIFGRVSSLCTQGRDLFDHYKQLTPTKDGSNLDTMRYAWENKDHTYKLFGLIDTGHKDYGVQMLRNPMQAYKLITGFHKFNKASQKLAKRKKRDEE